MNKATKTFGNAQKIHHHGGAGHTDLDIGPGLTIDAKSATCAGKTGEFEDVLSA